MHKRTDRPVHWFGGLVLGALLVSLVCLLPRLNPQVQAQGQPGTPTPTATATPTTVPFLHPPFSGDYRITSFVDHQSPNYTWDDTIVIYTGDQASAIDGIENRLPTFRGGYWLPDTERHVYYDGHNGIDYATGAGTTILAAAPGKVVFAGAVPTACDSPLQYVCIDHENGYRTFYLHLEGIAVQAGERVEAGDPVGISGNSGCSLGAHLHFAVDHERQATDPYGWQSQERPDPLIETSGAQATWLWLPEEPALPTGTLVQPPEGTRTNGNLYLVFAPEDPTATIDRVAFLAHYGSEWHYLGEDRDGSDGWQYTWNTRGATEGTVWLHAWVMDAEGRIGKASPIRDDLTVDRHAPLGYVIGLEEGSVAGARMWLYAASYDPVSTTKRVILLAREAGSEDWYEVGDAQWMHTSNWVLEWDHGLPDGTRVEIAARLVDGAGNVALTQAHEVQVDSTMPGGELLVPQSSTPFTEALDLHFEPWMDDEPISKVTFAAWYDGAWHEAGTDLDGGDGWTVHWDPKGIADQARIRVQARVYDDQGRVNTALPQATNLTLDRTPPRGGYIRPREGGVSRPGVKLEVWAQDDGSGVDRVEFYVDEGPGWLKIGEDVDGEDGWSFRWEAHEIPDGLAGFSARITDRAGNERWTDNEYDVAVDRVPPEGRYTFPASGHSLGETITLTLDVTDTVSGLDRAIFYARYDGRWHHLGSDVEAEDGFSLAWDTTRAGDWTDVSLTAWVYDRAGNQVTLPVVEGLTIGMLPPTPTPTVVPPTATPSPTPQPSATPAATPTALPATAATSQPAVELTPTGVVVAAEGIQATMTPLPVPTWTHVMGLGQPSVPPLFWGLVGVGAILAAIMIYWSVRDLRGRV